jgi:hypothetical protein
MYLLKVVPASKSDTCLTFPHDGFQAIDIKEEEEEDPLSGTFPVIKAEPEVSCMAVETLLGTFHN